MRIQDGHFGALSWRIKQIIGLSRRNTKEGATKQARKGKGNTEHFVGASHIIRYYVFTCTVVMVAPTRRMPHATCHTAPSRLDQHFLYWLRKKRRKSKQAKRANGLKRRTRISRNFPTPRRRKKGKQRRKWQWYGVFAGIASPFHNFYLN